MADGGLFRHIVERLRAFMTRRGEKKNIASTKLQEKKKKRFEKS